MIRQKSLLSYGWKLLKTLIRVHHRWPITFSVCRESLAPALSTNLVSEGWLHWLWDFTCRMFKCLPHTQPHRGPDFNKAPVKNCTLFPGHLWRRSEPSFLGLSRWWVICWVPCFHARRILCRICHLMEHHLASCIMTPPSAVPKRKKADNTKS